MIKIKYINSRWDSAYYSQPSTNSQYFCLGWMSIEWAYIWARHGRYSWEYQLVEYELGYFDDGKVTTIIILANWQEAMTCILTKGNIWMTFIW